MERYPEPHDPSHEHQQNYESHDTEAILPELNPQQQLFSELFEQEYGIGAIIESPDGRYRGTAAEFALQCSHTKDIDAQGLFDMLAVGVRLGSRIYPGTHQEGQA